MSRSNLLGKLNLVSRKWMMLTASAVVALGVVWLLTASRSSAQEGERRPLSTNGQPVSVTLAHATRERVPIWYEATGTVRPQFEADLASKVMGRIIRLDVREGDTVRAGQLVAWLDSRDLNAAVAQAGAGARAARVGADTAVVAAKMERSSSEARIAAARALVRQSEAAVAAARARLDMVKTGPRRQERAQAALAVAQAKAAMELAEADYERMASLLSEGAVSKQQADAARTQRDVARAKHAAAVEALNMAEEGSREEDIRSAEEGLRQAEAALDAARQGLRQAEAAALMADVREREIQGAKAQVSQATAALELARTTREYAVLHAPFAGIVARRMADPGDMATPGMPLLCIQGGSLRMEAVVPETVLKSVRVGQYVEVQLDAYGGRLVRGPVVEMSPQGDPASHTFLVRVELPRTSGAMAGMFGRVRIATGEERKLTVPLEAVRDRDGIRYVYTLHEPDQVRMRLVTVGAVFGARVVILSGLREGERVAVSPIAGLYDGAKVRF